MAELLPYIMDLARAMVFVDGENFAIRYGNMLKQANATPKEHIVYVPNVLVWSSRLSVVRGGAAVIRRHYYTSVQGDDVLIAKTERQLKDAGIEAPRVFRKDKTKGSKRVDISLATAMLLHASRKHYDIAVLVAGDEDYVPLVRAVQGEGALVYVWFVSDGLSPALQHSADYYADIEALLFSDA